MARLLEQLGIYGFPEADETALIASFLTGDPALLIGEHGAAKTGLAKSIGYQKAL